MSGAECYHTPKSNFKDNWKEINEVIEDGQVEINPGDNVPVEIFLGGDYKVTLVFQHYLTTITTPAIRKGRCMFHITLLNCNSCHYKNKE
jgi:hypothetical protein